MCADSGCAITAVACQPFSATAYASLKATLTANNGLHLKVKGAVTTTLTDYGMPTSV